MKNITKTTQTILFASLIAAMIIPVTGMNNAFAEISIEQVNIRIQTTLEKIDTVQEKLKNATENSQKNRLQERLDKLEDKLDRQIERLSSLSEPIFEQYRIDAEIRITEKQVEFETLYEQDSEFTNAVDTVRKITSNSSYVDNDEQWNEVFNALQTMIQIKTNESSSSDISSAEESEMLRDLVRNEISRQTISNEIQQLVESTPTQIQSAACDALTDDATPALFQPQSDYNSPASNGLMNVYTVMYEGASISSSLNGKCVLEVNLVYEDEDYALSSAGDELYDLYRESNWGRTIDIETMYVVSDESTGVGERMSFIEMTLYPTNGGTKDLQAIYSGSNSNWTQDEHNVDQNVYPVYSYTGNPVVFVNTWNHALGETYNSSVFPAYAFQLDNYAGTATRPMVENAHSSIDYEGWYGLSPIP